MRLAVRNNHTLPFFLRFNSFETARILLDRGANANAQMNAGETPLHVSARFNNSDITKLLVSNKNIDLESRDTIMHTPLHSACSYGHHEIVQVCVECTVVSLLSIHCISAPSIKRTLGKVPKFPSQYNNLNTNNGGYRGMGFRGCTLPP
jgi:ankyrin repeat protein